MFSPFPFPGVLRVEHTLLIVLALLSAGCSPTYNWREVRPADVGVAVMLPGKPASLTRRIQLADQERVMSMTGAQAADIAFTVACAVLPDAQPGPREQTLAAMRAGMVRNIAGAEERAEPVSVALTDARGAALGRVEGVRLSANGTAQGRRVRLQAIFVAEGARACQAVAVGEGLPDEEARTFLDSLRLIAPAA
jgi:hypothetical protein